MTVCPCHPGYTCPACRHDLTTIANAMHRPTPPGRTRAMQVLAALDARLVRA